MPTLRLSGSEIVSGWSAAAENHSSHSIEVFWETHLSSSRDEALQSDVIGCPAILRCAVHSSFVIVLDHVEDQIVLDIRSLLYPSLKFVEMEVQYKIEKEKQISCKAKLPTKTAGLLPPAPFQIPAFCNPSHKFIGCQN
ncbi:hypothetical protein VTL71DRAFT_12991 [Oculimacula yallundae]|uniref:Uncharacterized protein n=1 Tax=Oculimacula yallundae TaxID=86028 RepID=A0ABR4CP72_9HELO